jgi:ATP-dependent RNA helicase HelY
VKEYRRLRASARRSPAGVTAEAQERVRAALTRLAPGDVVVLDGRRAAVLSVAFRKGRQRLHLIDERSKPWHLPADDLTTIPTAVGSIELPEPYNPNNRAFQHQIGESLRRARLDPSSGAPDGAVDPDPADDEADRHPVAACPARDTHVRSAVQADRVRRDLAELSRQVHGRTGSLARRFDRVLRLLETWGYLDGWSLTTTGEVLAGTFHESDLLVAEALTSGLLDDLDVPSLAAVLSTITYEHRGRERPPAPRFPSSLVRERVRSLSRVAASLADDEEAAGLPATRPPDPGFVHLAAAWARGDRLADVLAHEALSGGDFVRNVKQLVDLCRGVADVAPVPATATRARRAADALQRGVVTATSALEIGDDLDGEAVEDLGADPEG